MGIENQLYPFNAFYIPEKFVQKAKKELSETEENKNLSLKQLREVILSDTSLSCRTTDDFLVMFLRARKYNIPRAFSLVKKYLNFKRKNAHIFTNMNYENMAKLVKDEVFGFLPDRCPDGCAVLVIHLNNWNPSEISVDDIIKSVVLFLYHSINDPLTQINGYKLIFDVNSPGIRHLRYCTPYYMFLMYSGTQECFPGRFKEIHIVNISITFKAAWAIINKFLSEKLKNRIVFHKSKDSLTDYFPEKSLPVDLGGELKSYNSLPFLENAFTNENLEKLAHYENR